MQRSRSAAVRWERPQFSYAANDGRPAVEPCPVAGGTYFAPPGAYDVRLARTLYQHGVANRLVRRMYAWRGYNIQAAASSIKDPNRATLAVWHDENVVATLTIRRDSPAGLLADALYERELTAIRAPGRTVCEVTRLAVHPAFSSWGMLNSLFQTALQYGRRHFSASDAVIEVNPRHARYYERRFGFRLIGDERCCERVNAPAVLLHQALDSMVVVAEPRRDAFVGTPADWPEAQRLVS